MLLTAAPVAADAVRNQHLDEAPSARLASGFSSCVATANIKGTSDLRPESWWGYDSSWNRYAYVMNNPLAFLDPGGEATVSVRSRDRQHAMMQYRAAEFVVTGGLVSGGVQVASKPAVGLLKRAVSTIRSLFSRRHKGAGRVAGLVDEVGQGFRSFSAFKRAHGPAGEGMQWHHIVEQTPGNVSRFGREATHNTQNLMRLDTAAHRQASGLYSSIRPEITGSTSLTVRQWLSTQSFEAQTAFGQRALQNISSGVWP